MEIIGDKPTLIVGKTFPKKLLQKLFLDDARGSRGATYFGDASQVLDKIPPERVADTVLFELDWSHPRSFNALATVPEEERSTIAEYVVDAMSAAYPSNIPTALLDNNILAASLAMLSVPSGTLYAARHLFTSDSYRTQVIGQLKDPDLKNAWELFHDLEKREQRQQAQSVLNRLIPLTSDPWYRNIIGQTRSFGIKDTDLLIVDLPASRKGTLLAALLMARLKGRIYVERPQIFVGGGQPIIACDYLGQLPEKLRTQMLGTATLVAFRLGVKDAETLAPEFNLYDQAIQLGELAPGNAYVRLDETVEYTLPENDDQTYPGNARKIRNRSRAEYGVERKVIEKKIATFIENQGG